MPELLVLIAFSIYIIYNILNIYKLDSIPITLSDTYYLWPKWVLPTIFLIMGMCLLPQWSEVCVDSDWQFLGFIACISLIFVGCFFLIFRNSQYKQYVIYAYIAGGASILSMLLVLNTWWMFFIFLISYFCTDFHWKKNYIFHIENSLIFSIFLSLLLK